MKFRNLLEGVMVKPVNNNHGFTIVAAVVQVSLLLVAFIAFMTAKVNLRKISEIPNREISVLLVHENVFDVLLNDGAWQLTLLDPANAPELKTCFEGRNLAGCPSAGDVNWKPINKVLDAASNVIIDNSDTELGWDQAGAICSTFASDPASCPYRMNIQWRVICSTPTCVQYDLEIKSLFTDYFKIKTQPGPIETKYSIYMRR